MAPAEIIAEQGVLLFQCAAVELHDADGEVGIGIPVDPLKFHLVGAAVEGVRSVIEKVQEDVPLASGEDAPDLAAALQLGAEECVHAGILEAAGLLELIESE